MTAETPFTAILRQYQACLWKVEHISDEYPQTATLVNYGHVLTVQETSAGFTLTFRSPDGAISVHQRAVPKTSQETGDTQ